MSMRVTRKNYGTQKNILAMSQDWHAIERMLTPETSLAVLEDGRKIVKAGTPYPSNDGNCIGLVFNDYDVTDGDVAAAILIDGKVEERKLPVALASAAKAALKAQGLIIFPLGDVSIVPTLSAEALNLATGIEDGEFYVDVTIFGEGFRESAVSTLSNWTIGGEAATKLTVSKIVLINESMARVFFAPSDATAAGSLTVNPKAAAVDLGVVPSNAVTIAKVVAA